MKLHLHIGTHFTGTSDVVHSLRSAADSLRPQGVYQPAPRFLRRSVRAHLDQLNGMPPIESEQEELWNTLLPGEIQSWAERAVFAEESWIGGVREAFNGKFIYDEAAQNLRRLTELFSNHDMSVSIALRNPAVLLHHAINANKMQKPVSQFLERTPLENLRWSLMIEQLRAAVPELPLTIWCYEDQLLIWPKILRHLTEKNVDLTQKDTMVPFENALVAEGLPRLQTYLAKYPPQSDAQFEKIVLAFLDKYANEEAFDEAVDLPGWAEDQIIEVTDMYEEDIEAFEQEDGITLLLPETTSQEDDVVEENAVQEA